jgi:hypothetical protein
MDPLNLTSCSHELSRFLYGSYQNFNCSAFNDQVKSFLSPNNISRNISKTGILRVSNCHLAPKRPIIEILVGWIIVLLNCWRPGSSLRLRTIIAPKAAHDVRSRCTASVERNLRARKLNFPCTETSAVKVDSKAPMSYVYRLQGICSPSSLRSSQYSSPILESEPTPPALYRSSQRVLTLTRGLYGDITSRSLMRRHF